MKKIMTAVALVLVISPAAAADALDYTEAIQRLCPQFGASAEMVRQSIVEKRPMCETETESVCPLRKGLADARASLIKEFGLEKIQKPGADLIEMGPLVNCLRVWRKYGPKSATPLVVKCATPNPADFPCWED
jgi:hypothetical protein